MTGTTRRRAPWYVRAAWITFAVCVVVILGAAVGPVYAALAALCLLALTLLASE